MSILVTLRKSYAFEGTSLVPTGASLGGTAWSLVRTRASDDREAWSHTTTRTALVRRAPGRRQGRFLPFGRRNGGVTKASLVRFGPDRIGRDRRPLFAHSRGIDDDKNNFVDDKGRVRTTGSRVWLARTRSTTTRTISSTTKRETTATRSRGRARSRGIDDDKDGFVVDKDARFAHSRGIGDDSERNVARAARGVTRSAPRVARSSPCRRRTSPSGGSGSGPLSTTQLRRARSRLFLSTTIVSERGSFVALSQTELRLSRSFLSLSSTKPSERGQEFGSLVPDQFSLVPLVHTFLVVDQAVRAWLVRRLVSLVPVVFVDEPLRTKLVPVVVDDDPLRARLVCSRGEEDRQGDREIGRNLTPEPPDLPHSLFNPTNLSERASFPDEKLPSLPG